MVLHGMHVKILYASFYIFNSQEWLFMSTGYTNKIILRISTVFSFLFNIKTGHMYLRHQVQKGLDMHCNRPSNIFLQNCS
jgi:hypothetical protein